jgi:hypothetical protein
MLSWLIFLVNMEITVLVGYKKFRYLSRITSAPRVMLSFLILQVNMEITVLFGYEDFATYCTANSCCYTDHVELANLLGQHMEITILVKYENFRYPVSNNCCSTDHVELADLHGQHGNYCSSQLRKSSSTCLE